MVSRAADTPLLSVRLAGTAAPSVGIRHLPWIPKVGTDDTCRGFMAPDAKTTWNLHGSCRTVTLGCCHEAAVWKAAAMASLQSLSESDRRTVAAWAADCAERVLAVFEAEAPADGRPREAIARARAFARGELDAAGEIRRRFVAGRAAHAVGSPAAVAAARAAAQAAGVAHMGAHALGAAAYAANAAGLAAPDRPAAMGDEISWQLEHMTDRTRLALRQLPLLGTDSAGPLGSGLLASGVLGSVIRELQAALREDEPFSSSRARRERQ